MAQLLRARMRRKMAESDRYRWIVLGVALLGFLTVTFTITILAVSIPTIAEDLGTSENALTWLITGPTLAFAVIGPLVGKLGDLRGHRPVYLIGLTGAGVFAGLSALAWPLAHHVPGPRGDDRRRHRAVIDGHHQPRLPSRRSALKRWATGRW